jgi:AraC-like DNA-binding protein
MNGIDSGTLDQPAQGHPAAHRAGADAARGRGAGGDSFCEVLRAIAVREAVFFELDPGAPRSAQADGVRPAPCLPPSAGSVIECLVVVTGVCWASVHDEAPFRLQPGDVLLLPHGGPRATWRPGISLSAPARAAGDARSEVIAGLLGCDARVLEPLLRTLPRLIHQRTPADEDRLAPLARLALHEANAQRAGGACALARLSELLLIEVVRRHWAVSPPVDAFWLGMRDDNLGRVLTQLHDRPAHDWTLEELARAGGMSRSVLAERFAEAVGVPPMHYLSQRRMRLAADLLAATSLSLAEIAQRVGYGSETSLSRAYKRHVGVAPAEWRRKRRATAYEPCPAH